MQLNIYIKKNNNPDQKWAGFRMVGHMYTHDWFM